MFKTSLLKLGRAVGLDNFVQIKQFVRALGKGFEKANMSLEIQTTKLAKLLNDNSIFDNQDSRLLQLILPENETHYLDIALNRYGEKSGKITLNSVAKNTKGEKIAESNIRVLGNSSGEKVVGKGTSDLHNLSYDYEQISLNPKLHSETKALENWKKNLIYKTKRKRFLSREKIGTISGPLMKADGIIARGNSTANKAFYDLLADIVSDGKIKDFGVLDKKIL